MATEWMVFLWKVNDNLKYLAELLFGGFQKMFVSFPHFHQTEKQLVRIY